MQPAMTSTELKKWIAEHYGRGGRRDFIRDYNKIAVAIGEPEIKWRALRNWMDEQGLYRRPPRKLGALDFEDVLRLILERKQNPDAVARVYTLTLPVDARQEKAIEKRAWNSGCTPDEWLKQILENAITNGGKR